VDRAIGEGIGECCIHHAMLLEQRKIVECPADDGYLEMIAASRPILDADFGIGKRLP
jgi:hypothetical protein